MIRKRGDKWCLYSKKKGKDGKPRNLGCYSSKRGAENREKEVEKFKHMKETPKMKNIKQIIAEEVNIILKESEDAEVQAGLDQLIQIVPGTIPELEKVVTANILPYLSSLLKSPLKEADEEPGEQRPGAAGVAKEMGAHAAKTGAAASKVAGYLMSHIPGGKKTGVMIATALDSTTEDHVRNAVLFALGNLLAGSMGLELPDLGSLLQEIPETAWEMLPFTDDNQEWDWGVINALDDVALLTWAWLKVKNAVDVEEKLHEFGKFIGRSNLGKQPETAPEGPGRDDMSFDAKAARAGAAQEKSKRFKGIKEMKIKKSELYKIIQEELEVVLTNEEAEEMFDLDMSALLDEMMEEGLPFMKDVERARRGEIPPKQAAKIKAASDAMKTRAGDPSRTSQGGDEEVEEISEDDDKSESEGARLASSPDSKKNKAAVDRRDAVTPRVKRLRRKRREAWSQGTQLPGDELQEKEDKWIQGADLKKGRCTPMGTPECPEGSPQYNLAKRFKSGDIHKANLKKGKNPHGPG